MVAGVVAAVAGAAPAVAAGGGPITGYAGQCLTAAWDGNGAPVRMSPCDGRAGQQWARWYDGTLHGLGGKCLDIKDYGTANGSRVQLWDCAWSPNQVWSDRQHGSPGITLFNAAAGKCLDVEEFRRDDGAPVQIWDCAWGQSNQQWSVPGWATTELHAIGSPNLCWSADSSANGTPVLLRPCALPGPDDQVAIVGGELRIRDKCVDIKDYAWDVGARLQLWTCARTWNQQWRVERPNWKFYTLARVVNPANGLAVQPASALAPGVPLEMRQAVRGPSADSLEGISWQLSVLPTQP